MPDAWVLHYLLKLAKLYAPLALKPRVRDGWRDAPLQWR